MGDAELPTSWADMRLDPRIVEALRTMKWVSPTTVQQACVPPALKGRDLSIQSRTGSGKTGAFAIPVVQHVLTRRERAKAAGSASSIHPTGLILLPSIELCEQTAEATKAIAKYIKPRIVVENLCTSGATNTAAQGRVQSADVVVTTAALLSKSLRSGHITSKVLETLQMLVIDEADLVVSIADSSLRVVQEAMPTSLQVILCSATLTEGVATIKGQLLRNPTTVTLTAEDDDSDTESHKGGNGATPSGGASDGTVATPSGTVVESRVTLRETQRSSIEQYYLVSTEECHNHTLLYALYRLRLIKGKTLIFVNDEEDTYRLQHFLEQMSISAVVYDSTLPMNVRLDVLRRFQKDEVLTLICTDSTLENAERMELTLEDGGAGGNHGKRARSNNEESGSALHRGVDFNKVRNVILFNGIEGLSALNLSRYTHRIGRTGRAGQPGVAITLLTVPQAARMIRGFRDYVQSKGSTLNPFRKMQRSEAAKLQYRVDSVLANVTRNATKRLRVATVAAELTRSSYLANHMSSKETEMLNKIVKRSKRSIRCDRSLLDVPEYMDIKDVAGPQKFMKRVNVAAGKRRKGRPAGKKGGAPDAAGKGKKGGSQPAHKHAKKSSVDPLKVVAAKLKPQQQKKK